MKRILIAAAAAAILLSLPITGFAHRLDEYLQATLLSIEPGRIEGAMRLIPGVAVSSTVISSIDTNSDGILSSVEQHAYAQRVLTDISISIDAQPLSLHLDSFDFPLVEVMKQGTGEILINFSAELPPGATDRRLIFENHHQSNIAVYLVNSLVPRDPTIQITAQSRNENQSFYQLDFTHRSAGPYGSAATHTSSVSFSGFAAAFGLGLRHIAEGTDHLLFLLTLLLPAPLLAAHGLWGRGARIRGSLLHVVRIVTAFTVGHSLTLALSAFGLVSLPSRPVEVLIAVSILVSAIHAIYPLFPGREPAIAAFFGLIHGLAFASALSDLGFAGWYRLVSLVGFNLGIETMQLAVVAATLPSLLLMSRTRAYAPLRIAGALFAAAASLGWIVERAFNTRTTIDPLMEAIAHHGSEIAVAIFLISLMCWFMRTRALARQLALTPVHLRKSALNREM
jgi:HupE / UreJ protein